MQNKVASAISKTKSNLIDVARQLFAKKGVENTTMNDIAKASKRGRRTLYTYFNSKNDIYNAVIESELKLLYEKLEDVVNRDMPADDKLVMLAFTRLNAIKDVVTRNGTLKADFFRDIWQVETVRKGFDKKEINYLKTIIKDGCDKDLFELKDIRQTAELLHYAFKGLEVPTIRGVLKLDYNKKEDRELISNLVFKGIYAK